MKKLLLASLSIVMLSGLAWSDNLTVKAPVTDRGVAAHPMYAGYKYKYISGSVEQAICTGRCLVAQFIMSTGPSTVYFRLRDTDTVAGFTTYALPPIAFSATSTGAKWPVLSHPIRSDTGWTLQLIGAPSTNTSDGNFVTVLYVTY